MKIDLHMHTYYSDGTNTPGELVEIAKSKDMDCISITDHNTISAYDDLKKEDLGKLKIVKGVEIDGIYNGYNVHVLAYGFDMNNQAFIDMVKSAESLLDKVDSLIMSEIKKKHPIINLNDFDSFEYNRKLGGWKGVHYLISIGLVNSLKEALMMYMDYIDCYSKVEFLDVKEIVNIIHQANGFAILAHPGKVFETNNIDEFKNIVKEVVTKNNFDGIECYYPKHNNEVTNALLDISKDLLVSVGCDYHGSFTTARMFQINDYPLLNIQFDEAHFFNNIL